MKIIECSKFLLIFFIINKILTTYSKEHVVFERIGQMSGATSFIHVHVTLGIDLLTSQVDKYRELLNKNFNSTEKVTSIFMAHAKIDNTTAYHNSIQTMAAIWFKVAMQHKLDVLDLYVQLESLKNTMPDLPDKSVRKIQEREVSKKYQRFSMEEWKRLKELEKEMGLREDSEIITHRFESPSVKPEDPPLPHYLPMFVQHSNNDSVSNNTSKPKTFSRASSIPRMPFARINTEGEPDYMVDATALSPVHLRRRRLARHRRSRARRLAGIIALPMAVAATAMGIYNLDQINFLKVELVKLQDNQDRLFDIVSRHEQVLSEIADGFAILVNAIRTSLIFNPALFDSRLTRIENQIRTQLRKVTHALQAGLVRKLAVDYLTPGEIRKLYSELVLTAQKLKCDLLVHHHSDLFQLETSLLFDGEDAHLLIHVPMVPHQALLRLYKLHPIPLPLSETYFLIPDVKNDVLAISASDSRYAVQLSSADLMGCFRANQMFMCERFGVLNRGYNDTCLGALYNQQFITAQHLCRFEVAPITERVYQLEKHHFLVYLPKPFTVPIKCRNGTTTERHLSKGHQEVFISSGCEAEFHNHRIMTDTSITFPADVIHFEWEWDQVSITNFMDPIDLPDDLQKLADNGISRPTLADLQFMAVTKQKLSEMVRPQDWGLSLMHTVGSAVLGLCIIGAVLYFAYKWYRGRKPTTTDPVPVATPSAPAINITIAPPPPSNPFDDEDEVITQQPRAHPLANDPKFRKTKSRKEKRSPESPAVHYHAGDDAVTFPYHATHDEVRKEGLYCEREDIAKAYDENTEQLGRHRESLLGKLSQLDDYLMTTLKG